jgi:hypothetical protein
MSKVTNKQEVVIDLYTTTDTNDFGGLPTPRVEILNKHKLHNDIESKPDYMDYEESLAAIALHVSNMCKDNTSAIVNKGRIASIKELLDNLDLYNTQLKFRGNP